MDTGRQHDWTHLLAEQLDWWWRVHLRPRMDGLTDEEYHWEPVPGMWGIRPRGTSTAPIAAGSGDFTVDFAFPEPGPPPATTIAWRMSHLIIGCFGMRAASHFGGPEDLMRPIGPAEGQYAGEPMASLVVHINREALHHGAEIALLRDLYRWKDE